MSGKGTVKWKGAEDEIITTMVARPHPTACLASRTLRGGMRLTPTGEADLASAPRIMSGHAEPRLVGCSQSAPSLPILRSNVSRRISEAAVSGASFPAFALPSARPLDCDTPLPGSRSFPRFPGRRLLSPFARPCQPAFAKIWLPLP